MTKNKINILFTFIIIYSLFLGSIYLEAASLITKTTFNKMNESLTTFYNNFDENDKYLTSGPFTCSGDRIRCTGSSSIGTLSKKEYEIIGSKSYLSAKNSNNKYWTNNTNGNNAYVVNTNSIEEKSQTDSYGIRGSVYVKNETTFSGIGTRIDPYVLNYTQKAKQDINLVAFYIDSDGDESFDDEPNNGLVDKIDQKTSYSLVSSVCTDSTGQEFTEMITYNDSNKSITISPVQYQLSCSIKLKKVRSGNVIVGLAGEMFSVVLDTSGNIWTWGGGDASGVLGNGKSGLVSKPTKILNSNFSMISTKSDFTLSLDKSNYLWGWGLNSVGQLGLGENAVGVATTPQKNSVYQWKSISAGESHSLGIDKDGNLYSWGANNVGQLGLGSNDTKPRKSPTIVTYGTKYITIAAGNYYSLAIDTTGNLWSWGTNYSGQLGNGNYNTAKSPTFVGKDWNTISAGESHSLAIDVNSYLWGWGSNEYGELSLPSLTKFNKPVQIGTKKWKAISAGNGYTLAIDIDGYLYSSGKNDVGQLGRGTNPTDTTNLTKIGNKKWKAISAGMYHSLAIDEDGNLYSWGKNDKYQVGNGTTVTQYSPYNLTLN